MSDETKKYTWTEAASWNAEQIIEYAREAALSGDRSRVVTAVNIVPYLKKIFLGDAIRYKDFQGAVPKPSLGVSNLKTGLDVQTENQQAALDWLKNYSKTLSPGQQRQLMKSIENSSSGPVEVDAFKSLINVTGDSRAPGILPQTVRNIMNSLNGDAAIKEYLKSPRAVLPGITVKGTNTPVTLHDILNNPGIRIKVSKGTNVDQSLESALRGLGPLLTGKMKIQQAQEFFKKAFVGIMAASVVVPVGIGVAVMNAPSDKDKGDLHSDISGTIYPEDEQKANEKPSSSSGLGITNGNIGNLGGQFSNPQFKRVLEESYMNQQDKMLPNPSESDSSTRPESPGAAPGGAIPGAIIDGKFVPDPGYSVSRQPGAQSNRTNDVRTAQVDLPHGTRVMHDPATNSVTPNSYMTKQNGSDGVVRTAADESSLPQMVASSTVPELDAVLRHLQTLIDKGAIDQANQLVMSLDRQFGSLAAKFRSFAEGRSAQ